MNKIGIDIGGTNIKGIVLGKQHELVYKTSLPTKDSGNEDWRIMVRNVFDILKNKAGSGYTLGLSAPGLVNPDNTAILHMPGRLKGLTQFIWSEYLDYPCKVLNDAHAAIVAEHHLGVGRGYQHLIMLTLGTGVGGGVILNGKLYQGQLGRAGHLGHITVSREDLLDITGTPGSLEDALGNATIAKRSFGRFKDNEEVYTQYQKGDPIATYVWLNMIRDLAAALASLVNVFSPEVIILGGGMVSAKEGLTGPLERFLKIFEWQPSGHSTPILLATQGAYSGAMGAAIFGAI